LPITYCEFKVIDGQHRLMGFANVSEDIQNNSVLPVIAFNKLDPKAEIKMFVDINSKQKRVDTNLVLLLKKDFDWSPIESEYYDKIAVIICEELNKKGPLENKIYFGTALEKPSNKVRLVSMVSILKSNGYIRNNNALWQKTPDDIETPLSKTREVIGVISKKITDTSNKKFFLQTLGLRLIFKFMRIIEKNRNVNNIKVNNEDLFDNINEILLKGFDKKLQDYYGEGGATNFALDLSNELKRKYSNKYKKLETNLRKIKKTKINQSKLNEMTSI